MSTQKSGLTPPPKIGEQPGEKSIPEVKSEIPEEKWVADSTGAPPISEDDFIPVGREEEVEKEEEDSGDYEIVAGRKVHRVSHEELMSLHNEETGGVPLHESYFASEKGIPSQQEIDQQNRSGFLEDEVDSLTPDWMRKKKSASTPPNADTTSDSSPQVDFGTAKDTSDIIQGLARKAAQCQADGDIMGAKALRDTISELTNAVRMERIFKPKTAHPTLNKLKASLGLYKIKPHSVEWGGMLWNCYPSNMVLDAWVMDNSWDDNRNFASLRIAAYCVGIDDVPLYEVFQIPLVYEYNVEMEGELEGQKVPVKPYTKRCSNCGIEVKIPDTECTNCGATLDPFKMPLALRVRCAESLYNFFQEDFGPTERLTVLAGKIRQEMKDRMVDADELYPLTMLSDEAPKTTDSLESGDE